MAVVADRAAILVLSNRGRRIMFTVYEGCSFRKIFDHLRRRSVRPDRQPRLFYEGREVFPYQKVREQGIKVGQVVTMVCDVDLRDRSTIGDISNSETDPDSDYDQI